MANSRQTQIEAFAKELKHEVDALREKHGNDPLAQVTEIEKLNKQVRDFEKNPVVWGEPIIYSEQCQQSKPYRDVMKKAVLDAEKDMPQKAENDRDYTRRILEYSVSGYLPRFSLLSQMKDEDSFEFILDRAKTELTVESHEAKPLWFTLLAGLARLSPAYRGKVTAFVKAAFDEIKNQALRRMELLNQISFDSLCRLIGQMEVPELSDMLMKEFSFAVHEGFEDENMDQIANFYELTLTGGTAAIALSALNYGGDQKPFYDFLESYEWRYTGDQFVMEVRYALWILSKDKKDAQDFLSNPENKKGLSYAVTALADLDAKEAQGAIHDRISSIENPVTREVFMEAIERLEKQTQVPDVQDRMIWMFGRMSSTEKALSGENDNIFVIRARETEADEELGTVYEVDDSDFED